MIRIKTWRVEWSIIAVLLAALGFVSLAPQDPPKAAEAPRVTGLGGVFFKTKDPKATMAWYHTHLGIDGERGGFAFQWREKAKPDDVGYTIWSAFPETTKYFGPGDQSCMLNFRVADLTSLLATLKKEGVEIAGEMQEAPNGKFAWVLDGDGRRVELWEPVASAKDPYLGK
jgi:predicted enzyme related to lactoylglutathione lyase